MKIKNKHVVKNGSFSFRDVPFMNAAHKRKVAESWESFVVARLNLPKDAVLPGSDYGNIFKPFKKDLYQHLSLHLGHIAHGAQYGLFTAEFQHTADFCRNVREIAAGRSHSGYGFSGGDYGDLNLVMQTVAIRYLPEVEALYQREQEIDEAAELARAVRVVEANGMKVVAP